MVINIWGMINFFVSLNKSDLLYGYSKNYMYHLTNLRALLFYEHDVNESKCLKISKGKWDVRVMVFNTTLKTSNILTLTVTDEGYSRNTAWSKNKNK